MDTTIVLAFLGKAQTEAGREQKAESREQNMIIRFWKETSCEHDYMGSHYTCDAIEAPAYNQINHTNENCHCEGGLREELSFDIEAATAITYELRYIKDDDDWDDEIGGIIKRAIFTALGITEDDIVLTDDEQATLERALDRIIDAALDIEEAPDGH